MKDIRKQLIVAAAAGAFVLVATPSFAQVSADRAVEQYQCKDILREPDLRREVSIAFLHGYLLGKGGTSTFNPQSLAKQSDAFIEHCLENPHDKALDTMMKVKK